MISFCAILEQTQLIGPAYHSTKNNFAKFNRWSHFGTLAAAKNRQDFLRNIMDQNVNEYKILKCYLNIKNPLHLSDIEANDEAVLRNSVLKGKYPQLEEWASDYTITLEDLGYDSIIYKNKIEDPGSYSYIVFDPQNISCVEIMNNKNINEGISTDAFRKFKLKLFDKLKKKLGSEYTDDEITEQVEEQYEIDFRLKHRKFIRIGIPKGKSKFGLDSEWKEELGNKMFESGVSVYFLLNNEILYPDQERALYQVGGHYFIHMFNNVLNDQIKQGNIFIVTGELIETVIERGDHYVLTHDVGADGEPLLNEKTVRIVTKLTINEFKKLKIGRTTVGDFLKLMTITNAKSDILKNESE